MAELYFPFHFVKIMYNFEDSVYQLMLMFVNAEDYVHYEMKNIVQMTGQEFELLNSLSTKIGEGFSLSESKDFFIVYLCFQFFYTKYMFDLTFSIFRCFEVCVSNHYGIGPTFVNLRIFSIHLVSCAQAFFFHLVGSIPQWQAATFWFGFFLKVDW